MKGICEPGITLVKLQIDTANAKGMEHNKNMFQTNNSMRKKFAKAVCVVTHDRLERQK